MAQVEHREEVTKEKKEGQRNKQERPPYAQE